jgi:hypothetical protein
MGLKILAKLEDYLKSKCSVYPINYQAEIAQFKSNYTYRDIKLNNLIRKMNYKGDKFPIYHG